MPELASRAPSPALAEHPEFALMLAHTLSRYRCTLAEVREDYWLGRAWRALSGDPALEGRVARVGLCNILVTGPDHMAASASVWQRALWRQAVMDRLVADTGHTSNALGLSILFSDEPVLVAEGCMRSLLSQTVVDDARWHDIAAYAVDLAPVFLPIACSVESIVAA